jgi:propionyl-CoA carboxylase alpha chain
VAVLHHALLRTQVVGPRTNLSMLVATTAESDFAAGAVTTGYLDEHPEVCTALQPDGDDRIAALLAAVAADRDGARRTDAHWGFAPAGWRNLAVQGQRARWCDVGHDRVVEVELRTERDGGTVALVGDWPTPDESGALRPDERVARRLRVVVDGPAVALELDGVRRGFRVTCTAAGLTVAGPDGTSTWSPEPRFVDHDTAAAGSGPVAPLPGTVLAVHVAAGSTVADGDPLVVIEAMKMEHVIRAPGAASVSEVRVAVGDRVDAGELLVVLGTGEPADEG